MNRFKIVVLLLAILLFMSSCSQNITSGDGSGTTDSGTSDTGTTETPGNTENPSTPPEKNYEDGTYTLMIYMCGSNLESRSGSATKNIAEMLTAEMPENTKVIIQTGGAKKWRNYDISASHSSRYELKNGELVLIEQNPNVNMGLSSSLEAFLLWGEENYPAEHRSVIFWDHGGGSMKGVCNDEQFYNDSLSLPEMQSAFASVYEKSGRKYEFVGFDACLMATYDMACVLEPYANYMIASEELEPSSGWDYKTLISRLGADSFYTDVLNAYAEKQSAKATYTLSAIDLSKMVKADDVVAYITQQIHYNVGYVGKALSEGKEFGSKGTGGSGSNLFDLGLLADSFGIWYYFGDFIMTVNGTAHEDATGMSLYFPTEQENLIEEYRAICQNELYMQFLVDYFNYRPLDPIVFDNSGYNNNGCLSFTLTEFSQKYVQSVGYELHSFAGSEETQKLYCVGTDNDISYENGVYTVNFEGNWIFVNDILLHTNIYEAKESHAVFSAIVKIDGEICQLLFTYFKPTQAITIEGYVIEGDLTSRVHELTEGTEITVIYEDPVPEDGQLYYEEGTLIWGEDVEFSIKKVDVGYYQYIPYVIDIYGNVHYGMTAIVYFDGEKSIMDDISAG